MSQKLIYRVTFESLLGAKPSFCASGIFRLRKFVRFHRSAKPSAPSASPKESLKFRLIFLNPFLRNSSTRFMAKRREDAVRHCPGPVGGR